MKKKNRPHIIAHRSRSVLSNAFLSLPFRLTFILFVELIASVSLLVAFTTRYNYTYRQIQTYGSARRSGYYSLRGRCSGFPKPVSDSDLNRSFFFTDQLCEKCHFLLPCTHITGHQTKIIQPIPVNRMSLESWGSYLFNYGKIIAIGDSNKKL